MSGASPPAGREPLEVWDATLSEADSSNFDFFDLTSELSETPSLVRDFDDMKFHCEHPKMGTRWFKHKKVPCEPIVEDQEAAATDNAMARVAALDCRGGDLCGTGCEPRCELRFGAVPHGPRRACLAPSGLGRICGGWGVLCG